MTESFDAIVLGLGAMGSAASYELARRGLHVLGIEQYDIPNKMGSSHGRSRVIRKAYFEDARYVPLLHHVYEMWRELEGVVGEPLLHLIGCLNMGPPDHPSIKGVCGSAQQHGLDHEVLDAAEIRRRWPGLRPNDHDIGLFEPVGGFLSPEQCIRLCVDQARQNGAMIHTHEHVRCWRATPSGVTVESDLGRYEARHLILTAGAWLAGRITDLKLPLHVMRQVQFWFQPKRPELFQADRMPVFIHFLDDRAYYGIPPLDAEGMKIARHHGGTITTAEAIDRQVTGDDEADVRSYISRHLPEADGPVMGSEVCMYTNTPDDHFILDRHPEHENVLIAGGFSGHGFKFAPLVGRALADMATDGRCTLAIDLFSLQRFKA